MGSVRVRFLVTKGNVSYWQPTKVMRACGFKAIKLIGALDQRIAAAEAETARWDRFRGIGPMMPLKGTISNLREAYSGRIENGIEVRQPSFEFAKLKPRTKKDYRRWLDRIEEDFGEIPATSLSPKIIKTYYHRIVREHGEYAGYHMMTTFRAFLSWCVSEDELDDNPGLKVVVSVPAPRTVRWMPDQITAMVAKAKAEERRSIAVACLLAEWLAQRPFDVRHLQWANYDGKRIVGLVQEKTGTELPPIPLSPELVKELDALKAAPVVHQTHIIFSETSGRPYSERNFDAIFAGIREKASLPKQLKFADFRRTGATDLANSGTTDDELRSITGHKDRDVVTRYAIPTSETSDAANRKRLRQRQKAAKTRAAASKTSLRDGAQ